MRTFYINGWAVDERGSIIDGTFSEEKPPLGESPSHVCIEGVLLPRNPDGSLQFDEHTSIAPEAAEGLLQRLQERAVTEGYAAHDHPSFTVPAGWKQFEGVPTLNLSARDSKTLQDALQEPWEPTPEAKSELDMLQEGCPHHDPVD